MNFNKNMLNKDETSKMIKKIINLKDDEIIHLENKGETKKNEILYLNEYDLIVKFGKNKELHLIASEDKFLFKDRSDIKNVEDLIGNEIKNIPIELTTEYYFTNPYLNTFENLVTFIKEYKNKIKKYRLSQKIYEYGLQEKWINLSEEMKDYLIDEIGIYRNKKFDKGILKLFFNLFEVSKESAKEFMFLYLKSSISLELNKSSREFLVKKAKTKEFSVILEYLLFDLYNQGFSTIKLKSYVNYYKFAKLFNLNKFPNNLADLIKQYDLNINEKILDNPLFNYKIYENDLCEVFVMDDLSFMKYAIDNRCLVENYLKNYKIINKLDNEVFLFSISLRENFDCDKDIETLFRKNKLDFDILNNLEPKNPY